jgi:putative GTP pyrophosphokinase
MTTSSTSNSDRLHTFDLRDEYEKRLPTFERAARNVRQAIEVLVENAGIHTLATLSRVKAFDSLKEKVERKSYNLPFSQATDCVGIRVIAYLPDDVEAIQLLLSKEFDVVESADKAGLLRPNEFGYRSHHLLIKIPTAWGTTPNYRGLESVTIEVQIRTILMHAWAEIEHKLQYKSAVQVPKEQQRRLFLLSAKVEEADSQFQALVADVAAYRQEIAEKAAKSGQFDTSLELNLDTFKELIRFFYPSDHDHNVMSQELFNEVVRKNFDLPKIVRSATQFQPLEPKLKELVSPLAGAAKLNYALDVCAPGFKDPKSYSKSRNKIIEQLQIAQGAKDA